jgi:signal transduction histidine kinase
VDGQRRLQYFSPIRLTQDCLKCHVNDALTAARDASSAAAAFNSSASAGRVNPELSAESGEAPADTALQSQLPSPEQPRAPIFALASIDIPLGAVDQQLARNRAMLLASGIVTAFLAMLAAYVIVRYIIVKPVQHLKDVSDEIARGNLNLRADISTGDEFEELSHAFNRMLRHMVTKNDELRELNVELDEKIDELARANLELFNSNNLKNDFLATISHELRTPLNSILGFSDILQSAPNLDDRQRRYVSNILTSGQSLMVQINDLLDLAKIESGKMEIHPTVFALGDVLELQVQQMMPLADRRHIDMRTDPPAVPVPTVFQDRGKISQIVNNLLSNAIKFTPEGGRIRVSWKSLEPGFLSFSVEDTGIGIPLDGQEEIFKKFRQGATSNEAWDHTRREYGGTGLGLSIVQELSRLLGGDVTLVSEFGRGSVFTVKLPEEVSQQTPPSDPEPVVRPVAAPPLITATEILIPSKSGPGDARKELDVQSIGD